MARKGQLRFSGEIRRVYASGKRFDGRLMTVFALANDLALHRLGITASRKAVGNSVQRNRAKRLVREAFRHNADPLQDLRLRYDCVFNARRTLLNVKAGAAVEDLRNIIAKIARAEDKQAEDGQARVK